MEKLKKFVKLRKPLINVMVALLVFFVFASIIAGQFSQQINTFLNIQISVPIRAEDEDPDKPYPRYYESVYASVAELKAAGLAKAREVEAEGAVLLKNNGVLPLTGTKVSLFGTSAGDPVYGGTGSGAVDTEGAPGFVDSFEEAGLTVLNKPLLSWYTTKAYGRKYSGKGGINEADWAAIPSQQKNASGSGEVAVFIVGRVGGEGDDLEATNSNASRDKDGGINEISKSNDYLMLNAEELSVLRGLKGWKDEGKLSGIVVLFNSANPIACAFLNDAAYGVDAAMWIGSVGQSGIYAVGDILTGEVNPSGSLPDTWWTNNLLNPAMANFGKYTYTNAANYTFSVSPHKYNNYVVYQEGIYVGYRYTETRYEDAVLGTPNTGNFTYDDVVAFPFGHGLSYTTFSYSDLDVQKKGTGTDITYTVSVNVTNTGNEEAGKKTVQIYAQKPYTGREKVETSAVELVGYGKTPVLKPGETKPVTVSVPEYFLTSYDAESGVYILEAGNYYLTAAENSHQAINNILKVKGESVDGNADMVETIPYAFDDQTYSKSYGTGAEVTSLFAGADINRYEGRGSNNVTYLSRRNWTGTLKFWNDSNSDKQNDNYEKLVMTDTMHADTILDDADLPANDDNWPVMGSTETSHDKLILLKDKPRDDVMWTELLDQLTYKELSRICGTGLRMTVSVKSITKPETLDHNGPSGVVQKYSAGPNGYANQTNDPDKDMTGTCYPCNGIIAATMNDQLAKEVGELIGEDGMWAGYAGFYGSGLNIHRTPYSGRVFEYFSEDGILTGLINTHETIGIQSKGIYVYNKHFVLNDQELQRSGLGTWCNEQALREIYLRAFELPIVNADAKCVMTAFNRIGAVWAGACKELLTDWLRGEAGMSGFAVTDMYESDLMSKPHEVLAGNDLPDNFTIPSNGNDDDLGFEFWDYGPGGSKPNAQLAQAMRISAHRVLYTVVHSRGMDGYDENTGMKNITPWWQILLTVSIIVLAVLSALLVAWLVIDMIPRRKKTTDPQNTN